MKQEITMTENEVLNIQTISLLSYFYLTKEWPEIIVNSAIEDLKKAGFIQYIDGEGSGYCITDKGKYWLKMIANVPAPIRLLQPPKSFKMMGEIDG